MKMLLHLLLAGMLAGSAFAQDSPAHFRILQINDVYRIEGIENGTRGGLARVRALRKQLEADGTPVLVMHAGDALYPSVMSKFITPAGMISTLNLLDGKPAAFDPYFIATFGNHEFDPSAPVLTLGSIAASDFRWVSSNTRYCVSPGLCNEPFSARHANVRDTLVLDIGGTKVGIFGITIPNNRSYVQMTDAQDATRLALARLKQDGAAVIIALTHQNLDADLALAQRHPEIDVVIGGHEHSYLERMVGGRPVTKADADALSAVVHDVVVLPQGRAQSTFRKVVLDASVEKDAAVEADVKRWITALERELGPNEEVARTEHLLEGLEPAVRGRETALGNLLADVMRAHMKTDVAFIQGGTIRINDNILPGPIRKYDLEGVFYYPNTVVDFELTGQQLLDALGNSVSQVDLLEGKFLQVSNIRFRYREGGTGEPRFTVDAADVEVGGKPLDLNKKYTVATIEYLYDNGHTEGYKLFNKANPNRPELRSSLDRIKNDLRTITVAALRAQQTVTTNVEGRITRK
ncbi:MAG TPA: bifunctional UDP-sugar hydrolase/5'-nucleotidase [Thermoanaerobaculia bacterium]|jgi:5'-nucleotidase